MERCTCLVFTALLVVLLALSFGTSSAAIVQPDNTCPFGSNYLQLVGFACIASEERIRDPSPANLANIEAWEPYGNFNVWSFHVMNRLINQRGITIGGVTYCSNFTIVNTGCNGDMSVDSFARTTVRQWADFGDFFWGSWGSTLAPPAMEEISAVNKIIFSSTSAGSINYRCQKKYMNAGIQPQCQHDGDKRWPGAYSMMVPAESDYIPMINLLRLAGARSISLYYVEGPGTQSAADGATAAALSAGIEIKSTTVIPITGSQDSFDNMVAQAKKDEPDAIVGSGYWTVCDNFAQALTNNKWVPKGFGVNFCSAMPLARTVAPSSLYGIDFVEFDPRMKGESFQDEWFPPTPSKTSGQLFLEEMNSILAPLSASGVVPTYSSNDFDWSMALITASAQVLSNILNQTQSLDNETIKDSLSRYNRPSFIGQIGWSAWGLQNQKDVIILQPDRDWNRQIVYPLGSATMNFIYPIPTFEDRVFKVDYMGSPAELALAGVVALLIVVSLVLIGFVIKYSHHRTITAASPVFLLAILVGSILLYSTYFAWVIQSATAACYLRYWLLGIGFVTMFGALFCKTWRIKRIFLQTNIRIFKITNTQLLLSLGALVGIEVILLAVWSGTSRPVSQVKVIDANRPRLNEIVCKDIGKSGWPMLGVLFAYKLAMVVYGSYMAVRIWRIPVKLFNESKSIAFSMYNMLAFGLLGFGLQVSGSIDDPAMFIVRTLCLSISTLCTILAIFIPKIRAVAGVNDSSSDSTGSSHKLSQLTSTGSTPAPHDYSLAASRNRSRDSKSAGSMTQVPTMTNAEESDLHTKIKKLKKENKQLRKELLKASEALQRAHNAFKSPTMADASSSADEAV